jgi:hypothetical protein
MKDTLPASGHEGFQFKHVEKWMRLLFDIGKNGNRAGHPTLPSKKFDDWSGMQFTTDGVKASLHFTKTNTQPEVEEKKPKTTVTKLTNGVLVVTIGPNGE